MEPKKDFVIDDNKMYLYSYRNNLLLVEKCYRTKNK